MDFQNWCSRLLALAERKLALLPLELSKFRHEAHRDNRTFWLAWLSTVCRSNSAVAALDAIRLGPAAHDESLISFIDEWLTKSAIEIAPARGNAVLLAPTGPESSTDQQKRVRQLFEQFGGTLDASGRLAGKRGALNRAAEHLGMARATARDAVQRSWKEDGGFCAQLVGRRVRR